MELFWTRERELKLIELIQVKKQTVDYCAKFFNVTKKAIVIKCSRLKISYRREYKTSTICLNCKKEIYDFKLQNRKFCGTVCSATYNNFNRSEESRKKQKETLIKTLSNKPKEPKKYKERNTTKYCKSCSEELEILSKKLICQKCKSFYYKFYRNECNFKFTISEYSFLFTEKELEELKIRGMYSASNKGNNATGISRDHSFSVKEGFKLNIKPFILSHPANCALMVQSENSKKNIKCSITLNELYIKIIESEKIKKYLKDEELEYIINLLKEKDYPAF